MANQNETVADSPKKSVDLARKELGAILGKMNEMRLSIKAWRLLRIHSQLKPTKTMKPMKLRARHLWILLIIWITVQVVRNRIQTYRHNKVRDELRNFTTCPTTYGYLSLNKNSLNYTCKYIIFPFLMLQVLL